MLLTSPRQAIARVAGGRGKTPVTVAEARRGFRAWRGERLFWAGLFTGKAGLPILHLP
ncbi:hypothetical protein [Streptomyces sp. AF1A]|jgi:hypothetical protein|uniref:hypothetical protein n=1 Tax=Streptomyces sp. AF1A TaxID=3394350 RepID=UPI0039BC71DC